MKKKGNKLAIQMAVALVLGLIAGGGFMFLRETLNANGNAETWQTINKILFQDITVEGAESAIGIFYILGQLFVNSLQLIIVPMVFTSIAMAICRVTDTKKLGRISGKTISWFMFTTSLALLIAGTIGIFVYNAGGFEVVVEGVGQATGSTGSNPLNVFLGIIPNNIVSVFGNNGKVLSIVFLAVVTGLAMNTLGGRIEIVKKLLQEVNDIVVTFLSFVINKFGPIAIFVLITRTFAIYGIEHLRPAFTYVITTTLVLFAFLLLGYPTLMAAVTHLNPIKYLKKIAKVAVFGFSTSSSAATLPLNQKTVTEELGVSDEIASFVLPMGMTINMDGTAIMQTIAAIFVASCGGYEVTFGSVIVIALLALVASIGTPAAPGAGAVILFTILSGMGYVNEGALMAYSLILAINRPIEMLVTSLNVVGDSTTALYVAKSEGMLNEEIFNQD
jgi:Na+/H+-dicarboxylate symporters